MKKELLKGLTEEQIAKLRECKNSEEMLQLAKAEGIELTEEQLEAVSGGTCGPKEKDKTCPVCGCDTLIIEEEEINSRDVTMYTCPKCNHHWQH